MNLGMDFSGLWPLLCIASNIKVISRQSWIKKILIAFKIPEHYCYYVALIFVAFLYHNVLYVTVK